MGLLRYTAVTAVTTVATVAALGVLGAGCTDGTGGKAGRTPPSTATTASSEAAAAGAPIALATLPPEAERSHATPLPEPPAVTEATPEAEAARLAALLAEQPAAEVADDRYVRAPDATPVRWMELMVDVVRRRSLNPARATRATSLLAVAANDGALAAVRSGTFPAEVVAAGATNRVASTLFPEEAPRFDGLGLLARQRAARTDGARATTIDAAWQYGTTIGDAVLAQAADDGATAWTGEPPEPAEPGGWVPTPGGYGPALEPFAGTWRPWHLDRGDQFRPPPPPEGEAMAEAVEQVVRVGTNIDDSDLRTARFWDLGPGSSTPPGYWLNDVAAEALRPYSVQDQAAAIALLATAQHDATIASWDAKYHYSLVRPVTVIQRDGRPGWLPTLSTPPFPAYTSGHSAYSAAAAMVMASLFPDRAEEFLDAGAEAGDSRVLGGIHYWFDNLEGALLGERVADRALTAVGVTPTGLAPASERLRYAEPKA